MSSYKDILSAELVKYNANSRGNATGDCVKRAISMAFDLPYNEVGKILLAKMHEMRASQWNFRAVYSAVIEDLGGSKLHPADKHNDVKLTDYVDLYLPEGTFLVETGKNASSTDHIVCVIDGEVFDSWNSLDEIVTGYYIVEGVAHKFTSIKDNLPDLKQKAIDLTHAEFKKYYNKHDWEGSYNFTASISNFSIIIKAHVTIGVEVYADKEREYSFKFAVVFTPTTTLEQAEKILVDTTKVRIYDRFYAINLQETKLKESFEAVQSAGVQQKNIEDIYYLDGRETRFLKSLPGWAQGLIQYLAISNPGQYSDSYTILMHRLPWDKEPRTIRFEAFEAYAIKDMLDRYYKKHEKPYEDYDPYEEY